jgi:hypothetical protein
MHATHVADPTTQLEQHHFDSFSRFTLTGAHKGNQRDCVVDILKVCSRPLIFWDLFCANVPFSEMLQAKIRRQGAATDLI